MDSSNVPSIFLWWRKKINLLVDWNDETTYACITVYSWAYIILYVAAGSRRQPDGLTSANWLIGVPSVNIAPCKYSTPTTSTQHTFHRPIIFGVHLDWQVMLTNHDGALSPLSDPPIWRGWGLEIGSDDRMFSMARHLSVYSTLWRH